MSKKEIDTPNDTLAVINNPWERLREFTDARIGLGRAGISIPTKHLLEFQLAHAAAQDAVHKHLDVDALIESFISEPWCPQGLAIKLHSEANDRAMYLQHPDYGRRLNPESERALLKYEYALRDDYDLAIIIADGLSAFAIEENAHPFLQTLIPLLTINTANQSIWRIAPLTVVEQGRVAIGDHIGQLLRAKCVLILVGERPGLSSPNSLGLYMTWNPKVGCTDANRNCISNIRPGGLSYQEAAYKALYLLNEARAKKLSGVNLKDRSGDISITKEQNHRLTDDKELKSIDINNNLLDTINLCQSRTRSLATLVLESAKQDNVILC